MGDLGKIIVAAGFEKLPKVQQIAQSGHTDHQKHCQVHRYVPMCCTKRMKTSTTILSTQVGRYEG